MRILFLVYAQQKSFGEFYIQPKTRFSWVDALIDRLAKVGNTSIGIVVPTYDKSFQKAEKDNPYLKEPQGGESTLFETVHIHHPINTRCH